MNTPYQYQNIPRSRIATFDISSIGASKHHVTALLEFDVTDSRGKLKDLRKSGLNISFNAWLIKVISVVLQKHPEASAYLYSKKKLIIFNDINVSMLVEKTIGDNKVPIPMVIERADKKSPLEITREIENAKDQELSGRDVVLKKRTAAYQNLYYHLPGFLRRAVWRMILKNPRFAYKKMGNTVVTSLGMMGRINGWFIHRSIHPVSFGVGSVLKKPKVVDNEIKIRDILNMTVLIDHDVIDGAPMVRFLNDLTRAIENGQGMGGLAAERSGKSRFL
jgi:pyruvate/2-oxoglutarate dehydrogenase complex dihydrolipoamide acyltransferase (E2) component